MKKKLICALLAIVMIVSSVSILASCGDDTCTEHVDENKDYKCDKCQESLVKKHTKHTDKNKDGVCDVEGCGATVKPGEDDEDDIDYYWDSVDLIYQMTACDTAELSSTCARYLAGEWTGTVDNIDTAVAERNEAAYTHAEIEKVTYLYRENNRGKYGWGLVADVIMTEMASLDTEGLPDMYCDMVYDLVSASLQGCFANLYGTVRGEGNNYFPFNEFKDAFYSGNFNEETQGNGYMYEYMTTLTLSKNKMYLLASDYFTDLVRAFYIVPVNITLLEQYGEGITGDLVGDGDGFTIDDFYKEVEEKKWTYNKVAEYSKAVYVDEDNNGKSMSDTLGFVLNCEGGLSSSGFVYSTSCTVINRELNLDKGDFEYSYPDTNEKLFDLFDKLTELGKKEGVYIALGRAPDKVYNPIHTLRSIAARFAANRILFGGVCLLGGLENAEYQAMKEGKGFGVVPVPLYTEQQEGVFEDDYLTCLHNEGRIGAISFKTQKFEQCTAFLNYLSTHSTDILDDYYEYKMQYDTVGASPTTVHMLQYIRNHVRSAFDKTFEDAMGVYYGKSTERWSYQLQQHHYDVDLRQFYNTHIESKQADLENLITYFDDLKD